MIRQPIVRPAAQTDIDNQAEYLFEHAGEAVAFRFLDAVESTIDELAESPGLGAAWPSDHPALQGIRRRRIIGFPNHLVFYRYDNFTIEVLHIYHGRQDIAGRLDDQAETDR